MRLVKIKIKIRINNFNSFRWLSIYNINAIIRIFIINNNGYQAIRNTQNEFLEGRLYGTHPDWNLKMPSIEKIAVGFEVEYMKLSNPDFINNNIEKILKHKGPLIAEVIVDENQKPLFRQGFIKNDDGTFNPRDLSDMLVNE